MRQPSLPLCQRVRDYYAKVEQWRLLPPSHPLSECGADIVAEKDGAIKEYLIVECVEAPRLDVADVERFARKVHAFLRNVPTIAWWDEKPPVTAVIAHMGVVSPEAEARARFGVVKIEFKRF